MTVIEERRRRERERRHQQIVTAARALAESEGWDAVTTRRLADSIEYSQPVLYSHFANKEAIVAAVAVEGFAELASALREAAETTTTAADAFEATARAYVTFASAKPALYDAMFTLASPLPFAEPEAPAPLHDAFAALRDVVAPVAGTRNVDLLTELMWSSLHGLVTLGRGGRVPARWDDERLDLLMDLFAHHAGAKSTRPKRAARRT